MRATPRTTAGLLSLLIGALGCSKEFSAPLPRGGSRDEPKRGGTLTVASFANIRSLDPVTSSDGVAAEIEESLYAGLVDYNQKGELVPDLAERFEVSPDGKRYTFLLRHPVFFHDGSELHADDVVRSIERALHPDTPNAFASFFSKVKGFDAFQAREKAHLEGVRAETEFTVSIELAEVDATFLPLLALPVSRPVCKSAGSTYSDQWTACGAGPFKLAEGGWDSGRSVTLTRHENYFRPRLPYLDKVVTLLGVNPISQALRFRRGELDILRDFTNADGLKLLKDPRWKSRIQWEAEHSMWGFAMNVEVPPFDNVNVRRAVSFAIDREKHRLLRPLSITASGQAVPIGVPGYNPRAATQKFDKSAALEHMRLAGYAYDPATKKGGYPSPVRVVSYRQGMSEFEVQILQQELAEIGLTLELQLVSWPAYLALTTERGRVAMSPQGWNADFPEAVDFYEALFTSRSIAESGGSNPSFYRNQAFDELAQKARAELDRDKRQVLYDELARILERDAPWAFTQNYRYVNVSHEYVRDFEAHPVWGRDYRAIWLDRPDEAK